MGIGIGVLVVIAFFLLNYLWLTWYFHNLDARHESQNKAAWPTEPHPYAFVVGQEIALLLPDPDIRTASALTLALRFRLGYFNDSNFTDADRYNVENALTHGDLEGATKLLKDLCYDCYLTKVGFLGSD